MQLVIHFRDVTANMLQKYIYNHGQMSHDSGP